MAAYMSAPALLAAPGPERDFTGEGRADVLWRHEGAGGLGQNYLYPMNGTAIEAAEGYVRTVADGNWKVAGVGDFDGNGKADILWRNSATGENYIYLMDGKNISVEGYIRTVADLNWKVAGVGDFDGDGRSDILWRNFATGENYLYPMNALAILPGEGYLRTVADTNWEVAGIGYFDADARADILWRNKSTGQNYIYLMNGTAIAGEGFLRTVADLNWKVAGVGDFDGDGKSDILWRNSSSGENYVYPMNGIAIKPGEGYLRTVADRNWQIVRVGNFDGAATAPQTDDILWRHAGSGQNYLWPMMGLAILPSEGYLRTVADRQWKVQPSAASCPALASSTIGLSATAPRLSGVAPLAVFFDATATTHTNPAIRPFHDIDYQWDFGDPGSGTWTRTPGMTNVSRNQAAGPLAAHVYETPGTYTVCVTAFDGASTATTALTVTVTDPNTVYSGTKTVCVRSTATGNFDGCPAGASQVTNASFGSAIDAHKGTTKRILFRRGDSFNAGSGDVNVQGPWTIGAFGTGLPPAVNAVNLDDAILTIGAPSVPNIKDGRVMDIQFNGTGTDATNQTVAIQTAGAYQRVTYLRVGITNVNFALSVNDAVLDFLNGTPNSGHQLFDEVAVVDSTVATIRNGGYGWFGAAHRIALLGNSFSDNPSGQHMIRVTHTKKSVFSHNSLTGAGPSKGVFKIHAMDISARGLAQPDGNTYTEQVVVSDNKLIGGGNSGGVDWPFLMEPTDSFKTELMRDAIYERNWFTASPGGGQRVALVLRAARVTVRQNVFDVSNGTDHTCVYLMDNGPSPAPADIHIYNNTMYSSAALPNNFQGVAIDGGSTNTVVRNNIAYSPVNNLGVMIIGSGTGLVNQNNSTSTQVRSISPNFANVLPTVPADFRLTAGSYGIDSGVSVPGFSDFFRLSRPQRAGFSRGAIENP